jgi:hypothetical protein
MNNQTTTPIKKGQSRGFWTSLLTNMVRVPVIIIEIFAPFFIDKFCGHVYGLIAAIANIGIWLYFGLRLRMTIGTRIIIWLIPFLFVILVAIVEIAKFFHWSL